MNYATDFLNAVRHHNATRGVCLAYLVNRDGCITFYPARRMEEAG